ncbi:MAG: GNAT family N-acetyltransferase [Gloeomargarita sp. SKYG116]|nr:GNAT family N-acetyltransferase [Gloeomargarita sp. SKYG116]MCS7225885.1 GNAT family N-acetyltransferase [Gloeomargarita sp. SKYB31]MDW8401478.1 GNAT family N-acetyltransferase [Gloeomargarita sp. SKYGB_i_bin116]
MTLTIRPPHPQEWKWIQTHMGDGDLVERRGYTWLAVTESGIVGGIQVAPFNRSRSTWQVQWVTSETLEVGSQLLRYALETVLEARTWVLEVPTPDQDRLALYRQNGFQPLAHCTYWHLHGEALTALARSSLEAPPLSPVGQRDAYLRYQLDTVAMPPLVRQVFDRHPQDFVVPLWRTLWYRWRAWQGQARPIQNYVFEPQRQAAIGYFCLWFDPQASQPHPVDLTVHPAYTWLYPQLLAHLTRLVAPEPGLRLTCMDYQPEREACFRWAGAVPQGETLWMCRSVWHKLREAKFSFQELPGLAEVLPHLQPVPLTQRDSFGGDQNMAQ